MNLDALIFSCLCHVSEGKYQNPNRNSSGTRLVRAKRRNGSPHVLQRTNTAAQHIGIEKQEQEPDFKEEAAAGEMSKGLQSANEDSNHFSLPSDFQGSSILE